MSGARYGHGMVALGFGCDHMFDFEFPFGIETQQLCFGQVVRDRTVHIVGGNFNAEVRALCCPQSQLCIARIVDSAYLLAGR